MNHCDACGRTDPALFVEGADITTLCFCDWGCVMVYAVQERELTHQGEVDVLPLEPPC